MGRTKEGGSVLGFVVAAIVLAGLLVGGAYFISGQDTQRSTPVTNKPQEQPKEEKKEGPPPAEPGKKQEERPQTPATTPQAGMTQELPTTGPREALGSILIIGLVTGLLVSYLRSRRVNLSL